MRQDTADLRPVSTAKPAALAYSGQTARRVCKGSLSRKRKAQVRSLNIRALLFALTHQCLAVREDVIIKGRGSFVCLRIMWWSAMPCAAVLIRVVRMQAHPVAPARSQAAAAAAPPSTRARKRHRAAAAPLPAHPPCEVKC